jgi:hypothetical protein
MCFWALSIFVPLYSCAEQASEPTEPQSISATPNETKGSSGHYKLIEKNDWKGANYEPLCDELLKNFNSFSDEPPMVCGRKFNSSLGFSSPDWQPIATKDINWEILRQIYYSKNSKRFTSDELKDYWVKELNRLKGKAEHQTILWQVEFDIANTNNYKPALKLRDSGCTPNDELDFNFPGDPSIHILKNKNMLDKKYSQLDYINVDIFRFHSHTFLSKWVGSPKFGNANIAIYDTFEPREKFGYSNHPICSYQYIP